MASEALAALDSKGVFWEVETSSTLGALPVACITLHAVRYHGDLLARSADSIVWINVQTISAGEASRHHTRKGSRCLALFTKGTV